MLVNSKPHDALSRRTFFAAAGSAGLLVAAPRFLLGDEKDAGNGPLHFHTRSPNNAEPPLPELVQSWITPTEKFYIRTHGPNPEIKSGEDFLVSVEGMVRKPLKLRVRELREFPQTTVTATLTCAGNRRREHSETKPVGGVPWDAGAIGNAEWTGTPLAEILKRAEIAEGARHVWFEGVDQVDVKGHKTPFGGSIPLEKAQAVSGKTPGCLVAWAVNGQPLTEDHGAPLRTIVPGYIGARSVKWLGKIIVSDRPSPNHFLTEAYKIIAEETPEQLAQAEPIYEYPINSAIGEPSAEGPIKAGRVAIQGYALPPGEPGTTIQRVEVSLDGGRTWSDAKLGEPSSPFCWRLWTAEVELKPGNASLLVRATDSNGRVQPQTSPWNAKGYLYNGWHKRRVEVAG